MMDDSLETFVPLNFRRRGARQVTSDHRDVHDVTLLEGVARGFYWQHLVDTGVMKSGSDIARSEGLHPSVISELMRLTLLAPDILELLMAGRQPRRMSLIWFQRNPLPANWGEQRTLLQRFESGEAMGVAP